jgi:predicted ArsR family transcriptional regulator
MSSNHLENSLPNVLRDSDRFLMLIKMRGPQTTADMASALGITHEAARQQLVKLSRDGVVAATAEAVGVGRPAQVWRLTEEGNARFPDAHADLTAQLIRTIRAELGEEALDRLISARERETLAHYAEELSGIAALRERVERLAAMRSREGYMAEWREEDGGYLLVENHCPICAAVAVCQGFCRAELAVFQEALGTDARVTRVEHIPAGARRCAYRIEKVRP